MNKITSFYYDILSKIDFSIIGYDDIEDVINKFFNEICSTQWMHQYDNLEFISFSYSTLTDFPFEIKSITNNRFFFNSFNERSFEEYIVSDYGYFRSYLKGLNSNLSTIQTSITFAKLFDKTPVAFKISCNDKKYDAVRYIHQLDLLSFEFPYYEIFGNKKSYDDTKKVIFDKYKKQLLDTKKTWIASTNKNENIYNNNGSAEIIHFLISTLVCKKNIISYKKRLVEKIKLLNRINNNNFFEYNDEKEILIESFTNTIIAHGFLSFIFNVVIENIPSVIFVDKKANTKRSLGSLIIGYKNTLEKEDRVFFRILSERVSSVLAGNVAYHLYQKKVNVKIPTVFSFLLDTCGFADLCHGNDGKRYIKTEANINVTKNISDAKAQILNIADITIREKALSLISRIENVTDYAGYRNANVGLGNIETFLKGLNSNTSFNFSITSERIHVNILEYFHEAINHLLTNVFSKYSINKLNICLDIVITDTTLNLSDENVRGTIKEQNNFLILDYQENNPFTYNSVDVPEVLKKIQPNIVYIGDFYFVVKNSEEDMFITNAKYEKLDKNSLRDKTNIVFKNNHRYLIFNYKTYKHDG